MVFISPDHKAIFFFGGVLLGGDWLTSHDGDVSLVGGFVSTHLKNIISSSWIISPSIGVKIKNL